MRCMSNLGVVKMCESNSEHLIQIHKLKEADLQYKSSFGLMPIQRVPPFAID